MVKIGDIFASYLDETHNKLLVNSYYKVVKIDNPTNIWLVKLGIDKLTHLPLTDRIKSKPFLRVLVNDCKVQISTLSAWLVNDLEIMDLNYMKSSDIKVGQIYQRKNPLTNRFERFCITFISNGFYGVLKCSGIVDWLTIKNIEESHLIEEYPTFAEAITSDDFVEYQ